jgi:peptidoglycan endopeptidase LytE
MTRTARLILAAGVALTVAVPLSGATASAAPGTGGSAATTTVDTTITVRDGDSLAGLAWRHGVRLSALLRANSLTLTSVIHPGDTIVIPAGATPATTVTSTASVSPAVASPTPSAGSSSSDYVIRAGDALAGIAWRHGVSLGSLVKANNLTVSSLILPGQRLTIPPATRPIPAGIANSGTASSAPVGAAPAAGAASTPAPTSAPTSQGSSLQTVLSYATAQVGAPYEFFSAGPEAFDCSGLVVASFRQVGVSVPHQSRALARIGTSVNWKSEPIQAGDLVFTSSVGDPALITHVGIALDSRRWVHAVGYGRTVSIGSLPATDRIMAVQRIAVP